MSATDRPPFERRLDALTTLFANQLTDCIDRLNGLLSDFAEGRAFHEAVEQVQTIESDCDTTFRNVAALVSTARPEDLGIRLTDIHLNRGQLIQLYDRLDDVANAAERFASEIAALDPPRLAAGLDGLRRMAGKASDAMRYLRDSVTGFIRMLCYPDCTVSVHDMIGEVRHIESTVDGMRDEIVAAVFETEPDTVSFIYRELALLLDGTVDAMEDVTDQMLVITGNHEWIDVDAGSTLPPSG